MTVRSGGGSGVLVGSAVSPHVLSRDAAATSNITRQNRANRSSTIEGDGKTKSKKTKFRGRGNRIDEGNTWKVYIVTSDGGYNLSCHF